MSTLIILSGIPYNSKKEEFIKSLDGYAIISRDHVRNFLYPNYCVITENMEIETTKGFDFRLKKAYLLGIDIVLTGTNTREAYIDKLIAECPIEYNIKVRFFDYPLWKCIIKNFLVHYKTGIFIPIFVLRQLKRGYNAINKNKYKHYEQELKITQKSW